MPEVSHDRIEKHEESGLFAIIGTGTLGAAALAGLVLGRVGSSKAPAVSTLAFVMATVCAGILARTALLGGRIRDPETRPEFGAPEAVGLAPIPDPDRPVKGGLHDPPAVAWDVQEARLRS